MRISSLTSYQPASSIIMSNSAVKNASPIPDTFERTSALRFGGSEFGDMDPKNKSDRNCLVEAILEDLESPESQPLRARLKHLHENDNKVIAYAQNYPEDYIRSLRRIELFANSTNEGKTTAQKVQAANNYLTRMLERLG